MHAGSDYSGGFLMLMYTNPPRRRKRRREGVPVFFVALKDAVTRVVCTLAAAGEYRTEVLGPHRPMFYFVCALLHAATSSMPWQIVFNEESSLRGMNQSNGVRNSADRRVHLEVNARDYCVRSLCTFGAAAAAFKWIMETCAATSAPDTFGTFLTSGHVNFLARRDAKAAEIVNRYNCDFSRPRITPDGQREYLFAPSDVKAPDGDRHALRKVLSAFIHDTVASHDAIR